MEQSNKGIIMSDKWYWTIFRIIMTFEKLPRYMGYQTLPSQKSSLQQETYKYPLSWLVTFIIRNVLE